MTPNPDTPTHEQIAQEFRYEPESERECRACGHRHAGRIPHGADIAVCASPDCECTESDRLIADLRHALAMERAQERALVAELRSALQDFGRHNEGCSGAYPPHRCKCGWDETKAELLPAPPVDPAPKESESAAERICARCGIREQHYHHARCGACFLDVSQCDADDCHPFVAPVDPTGLDTLNVLTGERSHRLGVDETLRESEAAVAKARLVNELEELLQNAAKVARDLPAFRESGGRVNEGHAAGAEWAARWIIGDELFDKLSHVLAEHMANQPAPSPSSPSDREPVREALERWLDAEDAATASATRDTMAEYREHIAEVTRRYEEFNAAQVAYRQAGIAKRDAAKSEGA